MRKLNYFLCYLIVFFLSFLLPQQVLSQTIEGSPYSFEDSIPKAWSAYQGGSVELSNAHFKLGTKSLKWNFSSGSALRITKPVGLPTAPGMVFWIYNETPSTTSVKFNLWRNGAIAKSFDYNINFKGWRCFWYVFKEYGFVNLQGPDMVELKSNGTGSGSLFFDVIEFSKLADGWRCGDIHIGYMPTAYDLVLPYTNPRPIATQLPTADELLGIQTISKRYEEVFMGTGKFANNTFMKAKTARAKALADWVLKPTGNFTKFAISAQPDGTQRGIGLFGFSVPYTPTFNGEASPTLASLVLDYRVNKTAANGVKSMQLLDYMYDQGWAGGSGLGRNVADLLRLSSYFISVILLQNDIKAQGADRMKRESQTLDWWSIYGNMFKTDLPLGGENSDNLRNVTPGKLAYVLLEPDPVKQLQGMKAFKSFLELSLIEHSGVRDFLKPDGSAYHHGFAYNMGYAPNALYASAYYIYMLHGTPFAVSDSIFNGVRKALIAMYNQAYFYTSPESTHGRFLGQGGLLPIPPALAWMALSKPEDLELMSIAKRMCNFSNSEFTNYSANALELVQNSVGALEACLAVNENTQVSAAKEPQLTTYLPFSGLFISRHKGWLLTIKGCSKYLNDFEGGLVENTYGRFGGWGYQEISNETLGYKSYTAPSKSWDWTRFPGTTARRQALEALRYNEADKSTRRPFDEVFLGGVNVNDSIGMFAFKFHDSCKDSTSRFRKSTFAFANVYLNLGTDIVNRDASCDAETTLFQDLQTSKLGIPTVSGNPVTTPVSIDLGTAANKVLVRNGIGVDYIVYPYGGGVLNVMRQSQTSNDHTGVPMASANYDVAVINHGKAPVNKSYRYMTLLGIPSAKVQSVYMSDNTPIEIKQQDRNAHVVYHRDLKTDAYAVFEPNVQFSTGILKTSVRPIILMAEHLDNNLVKITLSDPDLNRDEVQVELGYTKPVDVKVTLRGNYELVSGSGSTVFSSDGQSSSISEVSMNGGKLVYLLRDKGLSSIKSTTINEIQVFPNPVKDKLYFKSETIGSFDMQLYDQVGKLVLQNTQMNTLSGEVSLSGLTAGVYFLKMKPKNEPVQVFRIVK